MLPMNPLALLAAALLASFAFWALVAYGAFRVLEAGVCSVCGAVATVWVGNLFLGVLPHEVTLLLMGQSVVGGATLMRDVVFPPLQHEGNLRRIAALAMLAWFGLILVGTFAAGAAWLVLTAGAAPADASLALLPLVGALVASFVVSVAAVNATQRLLGVWFCYVCAAVLAVWVANLVLRVLPPWATILLLGESIAGGAALLRDAWAARSGTNRLPHAARRLRKQVAYFTFLLGGTLAGGALVSIVLA